MIDTGASHPLPGQKPQGRHSTWQLMQLSALYFPFTFFGTATLAQLLPARVEAIAGEHKGLALGIVGAGGAAVATLCMLIVGPLSDNTIHRHGRRFPWILGGIVLGAMGALGLALAPTLLWLLLAFMVARLGLSSALTAYEAIMPERVERNQHARAASWSEIFDLLGQLTGLLATALLVRGVLNARLGAQLSPAVESRAAALVLCGLCAFLLLASLLVCLRWIHSPPLSPQDAKTWPEVWSEMRRLRRAETPDFYRLYISRCVLNCGTYTGIEFLRYFVDERFAGWGVDVAHEVMIIGLLVTAGGVVGAVIGGRFGDSISKRTLLSVFCTLSGAASIAFCLAPSLLIAHMAAIVYGIGFSAINTVDWAFATNLVPPHRAARLLAVFQTCFTLPQFWVLGVGGIIGQYFGYQALFWTIPFYLGAGIALLSRVREPKAALIPQPEREMLL